MLAEQAARTGTGRGTAPGSDGPDGAAAGAPPRLVLVVDQFEELFTAGEDADVDLMEPKAFVTALHAAAAIPARPRRLPPALVVAAVRADYLGRLIAYPPLQAAMDAGPFTVGPMSEAELRLAVTGPAAEAGLAVEPALVEAVITELRDETGGGLASGVLPLMSRAMAATWERREGNELTLRGYRRAGGLRCGQPRRPGRLRLPGRAAARRGTAGIHPADRAAWLAAGDRPVPGAAGLGRRGGM